MSLYEELRNYDLKKLLETRGVEINAQGYAAAPWRAERSASVKIYKDHWHDFGSPDKRGDLVDWLEQAEGMSKSEAVEEAKKVIGFTDKAPSKRRTSPPADEEPTPKLSWVADLVAQSHEALKRQVSEAAQAAHRYFERRKIVALIEPLQLGVVDETVNVPQAGNKMKTFQGRAIIPILEDGTPVGFKARYLGSETDAELKARNIAKYDGPPGSLAAPFNAAALEYAKKQGFLVLTEGEIDAASLLAAYGTDYPVLGLSGGIPKGWPERISKAGVRVFIVMDPDEAGRGHAERYRAQLSGHGVRCYIVNLPGTEDLNEMLISLGAEALMMNLENAFEAAALESTSDLRYVRETWLAELDARARRPYNHYTTGLPALDGILDGGFLEGLHLVGGITGGGKTAFALHVALTNALAGRPVIYASYEQSRLELWGRIATRLTGVPYGAIKRGTYDELGQEVLTSSQLKASEAWDQLEQTAKHLKIVEGGDALSRQASTYTIEVLAETANAIADEHGMAPLIILDYLQRVPVPPETKIRDVRERVGFVSGLLQVRLARELQAPVLALSSIGRASYDLQKLQRASTEERLATFKEAGEIEYTAYTALLLYGLSDELQVESGLTPGVMTNLPSDDLGPRQEPRGQNRQSRREVACGSWRMARGRSVKRQASVLS